jgi:CD36 family
MQNFRADFSLVKQPKIFLVFQISPDINTKMVICSVNCQKYSLLAGAIVTFLVALAIGLLWPSFALNSLLYPQLVLKEGSVNFENWENSPVPIYFEIYMFNW